MKHADSRPLRAGGLLVLAVTGLTAWAAPPPWQRHMEPLTQLPHAAARPPQPGPAQPSASPASGGTAAAKAPAVKYIGSLRRGDALFVFAEIDGKVYSVRVGDDIGGLYRFIEADSHQARFVYLPTREKYLVYLD